MRVLICPDIFDIYFCLSGQIFRNRHTRNQKYKKTEIQKSEILEIQKSEIQKYKNQKYRYKKPEIQKLKECTNTQCRCRWKAPGVVRGVTASAKVIRHLMIHLLLTVGHTIQIQIEKQMPVQIHKKICPLVLYAQCYMPWCNVPSGAICPVLG